MTLSAAIILDEMPNTVSDILIGGPPDEREHIDIPTISDLEKIIPREWCAPVIGLARKTYIISKNLALCFAGDALAASSILRTLQAELPRDGEVSFEQFSSVLKAIDGLGNRHANVTASLMRKEGPISIAWYSGTPDRIGTNTWALSGSGMEYFKELSKVVTRQFPEVKDKYKTSKMNAIGVASMMLGHEMLNPESLQHKFGGGYEATYFDGEEYQFIQNYAVTFWIANRDDKGIGFKNNGLIFLVNYIDELLYIKAYKGFSGFDGERLKINAPMHYFVGPLIGRVSKGTLSRIHKNPDKLLEDVTIKNCCHIVAVPASVVMPGLTDDNVLSFIQIEDPDDNPCFFLQDKEEGLDMKIDPRLFEGFRDQIKDAQKNIGEQGVFNSKNI